LVRLGDPAAEPVNLTNTPDADEFDPAWSKDRRVARLRLGPPLD
jgi:hypothetical protein